MFGNGKSKVENTRDDYAKSVDFCKVLERDMTQLYLLAFLLTGNHQDAEQCFALTVAEIPKMQNIFKEWAQAWVKRSLITNAIAIVYPAPVKSNKTQELRNIYDFSLGRNPEIETVSRLEPLERFVFVMSVLERYSDWECSLLLGRDVKEVIKARERAVRALPTLDASAGPYAAVGEGVRRTTNSEVETLLTARAS
jgi:DNA-directed RNA polymerase specialized sigma24 family protein